MAKNESSENESSDDSRTENLESTFSELVKLVRRLRTEKEDEFMATISFRDKEVKIFFKNHHKLILDNYHWFLERAVGKMKGQSFKLLTEYILQHPYAVGPDLKPDTEYFDMLVQETINRFFTHVKEEFPRSAGPLSPKKLAKIRENSSAVWLGKMTQICNSIRAFKEAFDLLSTQSDQTQSDQANEGKSHTASG